MDLKRVHTSLLSRYYSFRDRKISDKILVIESDDWGSNRIPSRRAKENLISSGFRIDKCPFMSVDALATEDDLTALFEVLANHKNSSGTSPVFTANTIVANPDFKKIKEEDFSQYHNETFTTTLSRSEAHQNSLSLWREGKTKKIFYPQLHGREHLNIYRWMSHLRAGDKMTVMAFNQEIFGVSTTVVPGKRRSFLAAFDYDEQTLESNTENIISDAAEIFKDTFGYRSRSFIAPNYVWSENVESVLNNMGIQYIQSSRFQFLPVYSDKRSHLHFSGQKNNLNQMYTIRNCSFEPSVIGVKKALNNCLKQMQKAFDNKMPAVISSHRLNYIGYLEESNRSENLTALSKLLEQILLKWPDIKFMTTPQLGDYLIERND